LVVGLSFCSRLWQEFVVDRCASDGLSLVSISRAN